MTLCLLLSACGGGGGRPSPAPVQRVQLTGQVTHANGPEYVAGAQVLFGLSATTTDAQGRFTFENLSVGTYTYIVQHADRSILDYGTAELREPAEFLQLPAGTGFMITSIDPQVSSQDWPLGWPLEVGLSEPVDPATLRPEHFSFSPDIGSFLLLVDETSSAVYLQPERQLPLGQQLTLLISGDIRSLDGERLRVPLRTRFRTAPIDESAPTLLSTTPASGAVDWPINLAVRFEFNEPLGETQPALQVEADPPTPVTSQVSGSTLLVIPATEWQRETEYRISIAAVADRLGNTVDPEIGMHAFFTAGTESAPVANIQPEWNRARNEIIFSSNRQGSYDVFSIAPDGGGLTQLVSGPDDELHPSLSADGGLLAWQQRGIAGDWDIFVAARENTVAAAAITAEDVDDTEPVFSRTSSRSIFFVSRQQGQRAIYRSGPDGSGLISLAPTLNISQQSPVPHPQIDNQLLFVSQRDSHLDIFSLNVSAIDNSATVLGVTDLSLSDEFDPDWGPDSSFLAYVSNLSGSDELWVITLGAAQGRQVTTLEGRVSSPSLAPVPGDSRCVVSLENSQAGSDLVLIDVISGELLLNLTQEGGD